MRSIYEKGNEVELSPGSGKLQVGQRYPFKVVDGSYRKKVVRWNGNYDYPDGIVGKELDALTTSQMEIVKVAPSPTWPDGSDSPKTQDVLTFSLEQPDTGIKMFYGLEFSFLDGRLGKDFYEFHRVMTGGDPEEGKPIKVVELLPRGTVFTAVVKKDKKGYFAIDKASILPDGVVSETAATTSAVSDMSLSNNAKTVMDCLVAYKDQVNGQNTGVALKVLYSNLSGVLSKTEITAGWQEIRAKITDSNDNVKV